MINWINNNKKLTVFIGSIIVAFLFGVAIQLIIFRKEIYTLLYLVVPITGYTYSSYKLWTENE